MARLLAVEKLQTCFPTRAGLVKSVDDVSFHIDEGELLALVGEWGCGKSITALSIMRWISSPGKIVGGSVKFQGRELTPAGARREPRTRGTAMARRLQGRVPLVRHA